nr:hypothetical protein GCM10020092_045290 [Actinoplanes digitatis]
MVRVPAGTQVSTERREDEEPVVFLTDSELRILPPELVACVTHTGDRYADHWEDLRREASSVRLFPSLSPGEAVYFGLAEQAADNLLRLDVTTGPEGAGVDPRRPPRCWEAWDGHQWADVRILGDTSAGFNSPGQVTLLLPSPARGPRHRVAACALAALPSSCRPSTGSPSTPTRPNWSRCPRWRWAGRCPRTTPS